MTDQKIADAWDKKTASTRESRLHTRKPCSEQTHFMTRKRLHEGVIKNVSKGGTYIETDDFFFAGQEITVAGPFEDDGTGREAAGRHRAVRWKRHRCQVLQTGAMITASAVSATPPPDRSIVAGPA
jgi:hypothetical protein